MTRSDDPQELLDAAIRTEGEAQRLLLRGDEEGGRRGMREVAELYRRSWEAAPPRSFGRLIGMLKAAVISGQAGETAVYAREQLADAADSPPSWYAVAIAALVEGDDELAGRAAEKMRARSPEFARTAAAVAALAERDADTYATALAEIVADFESREAHLTGVPIADTALMLERLAEARGMAARRASPLLPPLSPGSDD
ncbi:MAG TPA: hypothetical protein VE662_03250 [Solirubrobacterales bacterium]|nr:hypothetical protein [Solirubrobacterales bacterium]